jgi:SAM-dependent methyltransferase
MTEDEIHKIDAVELSHWWYRGTREICLSLLVPHLPRERPLRILDVGCGTGGNLLALAPFGHARGIDISPLCVDYCTGKGLDCSIGSMQDLNTPTRSLDLVTMFDVLNQAEPEETVGILSRIAAALEPGGLLAFREPALSVASGAHDRAVGIRRRFTKRDVAQVLRQAGFEPLRITYLNTILFPPIVLYRRLGDLLARDRVASDVESSPPLVNAALLGILRLERLLLRRFDMPFGVSVFVVARSAR